MLRSVGSVGVTKREKAQRTTLYSPLMLERRAGREAFGKLFSLRTTMGFGKLLEVKTCAPTQERELLTRRSLAKMPLFGRGHRRLGKH